MGVGASRGKLGIMNRPELRKVIMFAGVALAFLSVVVLAVPFFISERHPRPQTVEVAKRNLQLVKVLEEQYFAEYGRYAPDPDGSVFYSVGNTGMRNVLPDFRPGPPDRMSFDYSLTTFDQGVRFTAIATGKAGTVVAGRCFLLDQTSKYPEEIFATVGNRTRLIIKY
jgi:hypothetical protein